MTVPTAHGRLFRALAAFSAHTAEIYTAVWGAEAQRAPRRRGR